MPDSYEKFYSEYKNKLFNYLVYKSGDSGVAQEIMQESFARHFQHYGREAIASPALLFTIARNALVDAQRYQNKLNLLRSIPPHALPGPECALLTKEKIEKVESVFEQLPEQDKKMLRLAVNGMPYSDIAARYNVSIANVKVRIHRSRKRLQQLLNKEA
ncbi:MAG: RNA polymerase sigma factor [Desulfofustis sp.]|nr:RNA polymerase sigma factor [Desulfofustis sp.]